MNLIGKIFIVIILVMSVLFMGLSMAVYSAHRNWPDAVKKAQAELSSVQTQFEQEKARYERLEGQLRGELDIASQQVSKLETERVALAARNDEIQAEINNLQQVASDAVAAVDATQKNNERLANENTGLRAEIRTNQEARDVAFASVVDATEKLHDTSVKLDATLERNRELTEQNGKYHTVMKNASIDPDGDLPMPNVAGFVSQIRKQAGATRIEITVGSDDGIKPGHTVEVFRGSKYLGRATIDKTAPDRAVGTMVPALQKGVIEEGDRVATRLKFN